MCNWKSGIVVKVSENECEVYTLAGQDSHTKIREHYKISEDTGGLSRAHTPVELQPTRGCETLDQFDLIYDVQKPEWLTDGMETRIKEKMFDAAQIDRKLIVWSGDVHVLGKLTLPKVTKIKGDVFVYVPSTLILLKITKIEGEVYVSGTLTLPKITEIRGDVHVYGTLTLPKITKIKGEVSVSGTLTKI